MNVYIEAHEALTPQRAFEEECLSKDSVERLAKVVGDHLQPKVNAVLNELTAYQMGDIEARMYDKGADLDMIQAVLGAVSKCDLKTRLMVRAALSKWLDLLDERD